MADHKKGDVVYLDIEGAPAMTVVEVCHDNYATVRWFGSDGALHERQFHCEELCCHPKAKAKAHHGHAAHTVHKVEK